MSLILLISALGLAHLAHGDTPPSPPRIRSWFHGSNFRYARDGDNWYNSLNHVGNKDFFSPSPEFEKFVSNFHHHPPTFDLPSPAKFWDNIPQLNVPYVPVNGEVSIHKEIGPNGQGHSRIIVRDQNGQGYSSFTPFSAPHGHRGFEKIAYHSSSQNYGGGNNAGFDNRRSYNQISSSRGDPGYNAVVRSSGYHKVQQWDHTSPHGHGPPPHPPPWVHDVIASMQNLFRNAAPHHY